MPRITDFRIKAHYDLGFTGQPLPRWAGENTPAARAWAAGKADRSDMLELRGGVMADNTVYDDERDDMEQDEIDALREYDDD